MDDPLLHQRHERGTDLDAEVAARDHHRVGLGEHVVEDVHGLRLLDLRDHVRVRARLRDQRAQVADVRRRADEGERDEVRPGLDGPVEVGDVLARERGNRYRHAGEVHALVRADEPADDHRARRATPLDVVDTQPHEPVVDQHLVSGLEHVPDHRRRDRELAVGCSLLGADPDLVASVEDNRLLQLADAELRALQVRDERDRTPDLGRDLAHEPGPLGVPLVRAVREVEAHGVYAREGFGPVAKPDRLMQRIIAPPWSAP